MSSVLDSSIPAGRIPHKGSWPISASFGTSSPLEPDNAHVWRQVAECLDAQWLASLGLRMIPRAETRARGGPACGGVRRLGFGPVRGLTCM